MNSAIAPCDVVAVIDDVAAAASVLEWSSVLARVARRNLTVVYVESLAAWRAAALPFTQALRHAGESWRPFDQADVERGYRAQAARLQALAEQASRHQRVHCSVRVTRDALDRAARDAPSDLVLIAAPSISAAGPPPTRARRVLAMTDDTPAGRQAQELADALASQLGASLSRLVIDASRAAASLASASADLLVMPRALAVPSVLARARRPILLVG